MTSTEVREIMQWLLEQRDKLSANVEQGKRAIAWADSEWSATPLETIADMRVKLHQEEGALGAVKTTHGYIGRMYEG